MLVNNKICCHCKIEYPIDNFYKDKHTKDGKKPRCKSCDSLTIDKKNRAEYEKKYWSLNKLRKQQIRYKCTQKNKAKYREKRRLRYNDDTFKSIQMASYYKRKSCKVNDLTKIQIKELLMSSKNCFYCNSILENDGELEHKIPLSKGGNNTLTNVVISCIKCNRRKGNKTDIEFFSYIEGVGY